MRRNVERKGKTGGMEESENKEEKKGTDQKGGEVTEKEIAMTKQK